jgi:hypothetical protein
MAQKRISLSQDGIEANREMRDDGVALGIRSELIRAEAKVAFGDGLKTN